MVMMREVQNCEADRIFSTNKQLLYNNRPLQMQPLGTERSGWIASAVYSIKYTTDKNHARRQMAVVG